MRLLGDDVLCFLLELLSTSDLLQVGITCKRFRDLIVFLDKTLFSPLVPPSSQLMNRIQSLPLATLRKYLRGCDLSDCIEKADYQRKLLAKILFLYPFNRIPRSLWVYKIPEWKASYYHSKRDSKRQQIMLSELCNILWEFRFKYYPGTEFWNLRFHKDYTMFSTLHGETMTWRQIDSGCIQVELYPVLRSFRLEDGRWALQNNNVLITQTALLEPEMPLVDAML